MREQFNGVAIVPASGTRDTPLHYDPACVKAASHGRTVVEAVDALDTFLNDALLASLPEVRIVHGRSGGKIRDAVHRRLRESRCDVRRT